MLALLPLGTGIFFFPKKRWHASQCLSAGARTVGVKIAPRLSLACERLSLYSAAADLLLQYYYWFRMDVLSLCSCWPNCAPLLFAACTYLRVLRPGRPKIHFEQCRLCELCAPRREAQQMIFGVLLVGSDKYDEPSKWFFFRKPIVSVNNIYSLNGCDVTHMYLLR